MQDDFDATVMPCCAKQNGSHTITTRAVGWFHYRTLIMVLQTSLDGLHRHRRRIINCSSEQIIFVLSRVLLPTPVILCLLCCCQFHFIYGIETTFVLFLSSLFLSSPLNGCYNTSTWNSHVLTGSTQNMTGLRAAPVPHRGLSFRQTFPISRIVGFFVAVLNVFM